jgi:hypothetical protein
VKFCSWYEWTKIITIQYLLINTIIISHVYGIISCMYNPCQENNDQIVILNTNFKIILCSYNVLTHQKPIMNNKQLNSWCSKYCPNFPKILETSYRYGFELSIETIDFDYSLVSSNWQHTMRYKKHLILHFTIYIYIYIYKHTNILQPTSQLPYTIIDNDNIVHHLILYPWSQSW